MTNPGLKIDMAVLAGLGGGGSILVEPLVRLLMFHPNGTKKIFIADGDTYEAKNQVRQLFDPSAANLNKAVATAQRLSFAPNIMPLDKYVKHDEMLYICQQLKSNETMLFIAAVDNDASRKLFLDFLDREVANYIFINPGNGDAANPTIQVSLHARLNGQDITPHPFQRYHNIETPTDALPDSCADEIPSTPQLITANFGAAYAALSLISAVLDGIPVPVEIAGHARKMKLVPVGQPILLNKTVPS